MNNLQVTLDSREVALMVGKNHKELLRDIRTYIEYLKQANEEMEELGERKIALVDFFRETTYIDAKGETRPCYYVTRKGCDYIATKITGVKGAKFTARYINRFYEMEEALKENCVTNTADRLKNATLPEITNFLHETSSFLREMDKVMRDQNSHPSDIAEEFKSVCEQFGIVELSENFVKEPTVDKYAFRPLSWITGNPEDDNVDVDYDY